MASQIRLKTLESLKNRKPIFAIGDVHGCSFELKKLINLAKKKVSDFQIVMLGDLFTKGPDPLGVFELLKEHSALSVKGNHDLALEKKLEELFISAETLDFEDHESQSIRRLDGYHAQVLDYLKSLPHVIKTQIESINETALIAKEQREVIIVHAGIDPYLNIIQTSEDLLLNVRFLDFTQSNPILSKRDLIGDEIVSDLKTKNLLRWHEYHKGPSLIVFGHDALQGFFKKTLSNGIPICMGLDTGCVYGKSLTGYFLDYDIILQVKSKKTYFDSLQKRINT